MLEGYKDKRLWKIVWPVCVGVVPIGAAFGMFAQKLGFSVWDVLAFSVIVFAGSSQFIAIAMIAGGATMLPVVVTTFIVNLRHLLFSSSLAPYYKGKSKGSLALLAYGLTDESFALNIRAFEEGEWTPERALRIQVVIWSFWMVSTVSGALIGERIAIDISLMSYALTAMFIGLWSFYVQKKSFLLIGLVAGVLGLVFFPFLSHKLHIVLSTVLAATAGCMWELRGGAQDE